MKSQPYSKLICGDAMEELKKIPKESVDLIVTDPPYALGKDFGNGSDFLKGRDFLDWTFEWLDLSIPLLKGSGSLYIFCTWQYSPEIFLHLKSKMTMINEIIWDRKVPSMGGTTRKFTSVHDNIGFFAKNPKSYFFDIDPVRIPYDAETKKARSRSIFVGAKWLEMGFNPKDIWSVSRLHGMHAERVDHPTQKPLELIERMVLSTSPKGGVVLDPFLGSGTAAEASMKHGRNFIGFDLNQKYIDIATKRVEQRLKMNQELRLFENEDVKEA
jgi:site-specific DNA-methyltransferase (adenine-specific)